MSLISPPTDAELPSDYNSNVPPPIPPGPDPTGNQGGDLGLEPNLDEAPAGDVDATTEATPNPETLATEVTDMESGNLNDEMDDELMRDGSTLGSNHFVDRKSEEDEEDLEQPTIYDLISAILSIVGVVLFLGICALLYVSMKVDENPLARSQLDPITLAPTLGPTFSPTQNPTTESPTLNPTTSPSPSPTETPTTESPTKLLTEAPSFIQPTQPPTPATSTPTGAPTSTPTEAPTINPTTTPTINPTVNPTPKPTLPPTEAPISKSRLPCAAIAKEPGATDGNFGKNNFKIETFDGIEYCGDTYGPDPERPNRNAWSVRIGRRDCPTFTYDEGIDICDTVGARWCTVDEFILGVAAATGCGGDEEFIYTSTPCVDVFTGLDGLIMFDVGLRSDREPFFICEPNLTRPSLARCCGDVEL